MSYKTISVCLTNQADAEQLLPVASMVARKFNAHLVGLYTLQNMEIYASISVQLSGNAIAEMQAIQSEQAASVKSLFEDHTKNENFVSEWRLIETSTAAAAERLAEQARLSDLVIMMQTDSEHTHSGPATIQRHVIEHGGRPVLVIPRFANINDIGHRVLIGWSGTGECARAVHDAVPFCQISTETRLFWVSGNDSEHDAKLEQSGQEMARALARHEITCSVSHRTKAGIPVGDELLNEAADSDIDLIVTGAFGHSRLYNFVIGATTSHLLKYMTVPVLFAS